MRPFTMYQTLTQKFPDDREKLVSLVQEKVEAERIFLLGASWHQRRSESIFLSSGPTSRRSADYFLLVLVPETERTSINELQELIEQHCGKFIPVTTIVLKTDTFKKWLWGNHPFALSVKNDAVEWYTGEGAGPLPAPGPMDESAQLKTRDKYYREGLGRSQAFLAGAELFSLRGESPMAAFMLHQAAEQALTTMLKTCTGFHSYTHNIDRMVRNASLVCYQLPDVFPRNNEQEKRFFSLLQKAYSEVRYKEDYAIDDRELLVLTGRVRYIVELLESTVASCLSAGGRPI
jgi:HEPN domain-containing protein